MRGPTDDEGRPVAVTGPVRRVVSIVPSLTEAVAATAPGLLVGATDWCSHPAELDVVRVRGTKNPDVDTIVALRPDLVLANAEENRLPDLDALRAAAVAVYVTDIRTLDGAFASLRRMLAACGCDAPTWLAEAEAAWAALPDPARRRRAVVPIWRRRPCSCRAGCSPGTGRAWARPRASSRLRSRHKIVGCPTISREREGARR